MKNVVAYCRVSTDGQVGEDKFGIEAQKEQIMAYCARNDMQISAWYIDEGVSGVKESRPEFDKILFSDDAVTNPPVEAVIVAKNDRIARDINVYFYYKMLLKKKNIQLISIAEDFGQFGVFSSILEAFTLCVAEMERENITKRTSTGRAVKASKGGYSGGRAPFGYRIENKRLVINESEAEIVRIIYDLHRQGVPMLGIANHLNEHGYKTRSNGAFYASNIKSILENEKTYRGMYKYGSGEWVKGEHEAILTEGC